MNKKISFEEACLQLDSILEEMSDDSITLDHSLELYAEASKLIALCNSTVKNAQIKIEEIDERTNAQLQEDAL